MKFGKTLGGLATVLAVAASLTGCSTVAISSDGAMNRGERLLAIQSDGYSLLDLVPLWSGTLDVDKNGQPHRSFAIFRDRTHSDYLYEKAQEIAKGQNCELTNVVFMNNYKGIDTANIYGLVTVYDVALSAVLREKSK